MFNVLDRMYIGMMNRVNQFIEDFSNDERGVSNFVATIIMILIVVLLCAMFFDNIKTYFNDLWARILGADNFK